MRLTPNPADVRLKLLPFLDEAGWIDPQPFAALLAMVRYIAACQVWTYSAPSDPIFPSDDIRAARIVGLTPCKWKKIKGDVLVFFEACDGGYRLKDRYDWIEIRNNERPQVPPSLRIAIGRRDDWTCGYCGSTDGPFDIDHVVPLARGGAATDPDNLICACAGCNRSKGAKLVAEWIS